MTACSLGWALCVVLWAMGAVQCGLMLGATTRLPLWTLAWNAALWPVWIVTGTVAFWLQADSEGKRDA